MFHHPPHGISYRPLISENNTHVYRLTPGQFIRKVAKEEETESNHACDCCRHRKPTKTLIKGQIKSGELAVFFTSVHFIITVRKC